MFPTIYCDVDGVLNKLQEFFIEYIRITGYSFDLEKVDNFDFSKAIKAPKKLKKSILHTIFTDEYFWSNIPISDNSVAGLKYLNDNYTLFVLISSHSERHNQIKLHWLYNNFPFIDKKQILFSNNNYEFNKGILIDDSPENIVKCNKYGGITIKKICPYNIKTKSHFEFTDWSQIQLIMNFIKEHKYY